MSDWEKFTREQADYIANRLNKIYKNNVDEDEQYLNMEDTVNEIVNSMLNNPDEWIIGSLDVKHCKSKISLSIDTMWNVWTGYAWTKAFSTKQGKKIHEAYSKMKIAKDTELQKKIKSTFLPKQPEPIKIQEPVVEQLAKPVIVADSFINKVWKWFK